jgi:cbb3-type cytochrome oxidase maturation protein
VEILLILIPLALILVFLIGFAFWWAVDHGQFDGFDRAAQSILDDDDSNGSS